MLEFDKLNEVQYQLTYNNSVNKQRKGKWNIGHENFKLKLYSEMVCQGTHFVLEGKNFP